MSQALIDVLLDQRNSAMNEAAQARAQLAVVLQESKKVAEELAALKEAAAQPTAEGE